MRSQSSKGAEASHRDLLATSYMSALKALVHDNSSRNMKFLDKEVDGWTYLSLWKIGEAEECLPHAWAKISAWIS